MESPLVPPAALLQQHDDEDIPPPPPLADLDVLQAQLTLSSAIVAAANNSSSLTTTSHGKKKIKPPQQMNIAKRDRLSAMQIPSFSVQKGYRRGENDNSEEDETENNRKDDYLRHEATSSSEANDDDASSSDEDSIVPSRRATLEKKKQILSVSVPLPQQQRLGLSKKQMPLFQGVTESDVKSLLSRRPLQSSSVAGVKIDVKLSMRPATAENDVKQAQLMSSSSQSTIDGTRKPHLLSLHPPSQSSMSDRSQTSRLVMPQPILAAASSSPRVLFVNTETSSCAIPAGAGAQQQEQVDTILEETRSLPFPYSPSASSASSAEQDLTPSHSPSPPVTRPSMILVGTATTSLPPVQPNLPAEVMEKKKPQREQEGGEDHEDEVKEHVVSASDFSFTSSSFVATASSSLMPFVQQNKSPKKSIFSRYDDEDEQVEEQEMIQVENKRQEGTCEEDGIFQFRQEKEKKKSKKKATDAQVAGGLNAVFGTSDEEREGKKKPPMSEVKAEVPLKKRRGRPPKKEMTKTYEGMDESAPTRKGRKPPKEVKAAAVAKKKSQDNEKSVSDDDWGFGASQERMPLRNNDEASPARKTMQPKKKVPVKSEDEGNFGASEEEERESSRLPQSNNVKDESPHVMRKSPVRKSSQPKKEVKSRRREQSLSDDGSDFVDSEVEEEERRPPRNNDESPLLTTKSSGQPKLEKVKSKAQEEPVSDDESDAYSSPPSSWFESDEDEEGEGKTEQSSWFESDEEAEERRIEQSEMETVLGDNSRSEEEATEQVTRKRKTEEEDDEVTNEPSRKKKEEEDEPVKEPSRKKKKKEEDEATEETSRKKKRKDDDEVQRVLEEQERRLEQALAAIRALKNKRRHIEDDDEEEERRAEKKRLRKQAREAKEAERKRVKKEQRRQREKEENEAIKKRQKQSSSEQVKAGLSQYMGVSLRQDHESYSNPWRAAIEGSDGRTIKFLGHWITEKEAAEAYDAGVRETGYALPVNFPTKVERTTTPDESSENDEGKTEQEDALGEDLNDETTMPGSRTKKYIGVQRVRTTKKFTASIKRLGQVYYIGTFNSPIEAARAYDKKAKELANTKKVTRRYKLNFPDESEEGSEHEEEDGDTTE